MSLILLIEGQCFTFSGVKICGVDCILTAEWKSPSKIIARTGPGKGKGDIIVTTKTGGQGTCTVGFKGYHVQIGIYMFNSPGKKTYELLSSIGVRPDIVCRKLSHLNSVL